MTLILFVAIVVLGFILADTRSRLSRLERKIEDQHDAERIALWQAISSGSAPLEDNDQPYDGPARIVAQKQVAETVMESEPPVLMTEPADEMSAEPEDLPMAPVTLPPSPWDEPESVEDDRKPATGFEDLFGRRLPIWAGGVTLLVAAVLLVKYSIDSGLLSPWVRVMLGLIFGTGLIAAAELARKMERFVQDDRVAQSLAGAGIGSLYAAMLAASSLYHLIAPGTAFAGLSAITVLAMGLALRFGVPCAVLALVGGLATPALVQSGAPNIPLLSGYLAMVIGSLTVLSRRQRWFWLGALALAGGMGWTALIIVMGELSQLSVLSIGLLVLLLGIALPVVTAQEERGTVLRAVAAAAASLQLALLVSQGGYDALSWGLYGLLSLTFLWLTQRVPALRPMMVLPLGVSLFLAYLWPTPSVTMFSAVAGGIVLIFGGGALARQWRSGGSIIEAAQVVAVAVGGYSLTLHHHLGATDTNYAWLGVVFAALPALGAALGWRSAERQDDWRFPLLALASGFLLIWAAFFGFNEWLLPIAMAGISATLLLVACLSQDRRVSNGALLYLAGALLLLLGTGVFNNELDRLAQVATVQHVGQTLLRWGLLAVVWGAFAWRYARTATGQAVAVVTAVLVYGFAAQVVPAPWLAITAAAGLLGFALIASRRLTGELAPAMLTLGGVTLLWTIAPLGGWLLHGVESLAAIPMLSSDLPDAGLVLRRLIVPAVLGGVALLILRDKVRGDVSRIVQAVIAVPALVGVHCLYKLVFALDGTERFIAYGLAERTLWEALLIGAGLSLWRWTKQREAALLLIGLGLAHNLFYTLALHDPLWSRQAVGSWPLVNLLLPAFAIGFAAPRIIGSMLPELEARIMRSAAAWHMIVMLVFAYASLRQLFCGTVFALAPVGEVESIFWSVLAIAMAIGWLLWGIRHVARSWRIGSLALMLAAIAKVFLIDASGLEGLLRVASFLALGFSLIGIGWLYSRFLRSDPN